MMSKTTTALVIVDVQHGFLPEGELPVPDGDQVIETIEQWAAAPDIDYVVATQDWHPSGHCSFADEPDYKDTWPVHCVQGTRSAQVHERIMALEPVVFHKADKIDEDSYSGFGNPELDAWLRERGVTDLVVTGLATDYCVLNTVVDALKLDYRVRVLVDGVRAVNEQTGEAALERMAELGAELR